MQVPQSNWTVQNMDPAVFQEVYGTLTIVAEEVVFTLNEMKYTRIRVDLHKTVFEENFSKFSGRLKNDGRNELRLGGIKLYGCHGM